jgi:DNA-binding transcriptional MerR regulator
MTEKEPGYTVSELESLTGINRRTIHFYVKEGVIAAPGGAGGGARYGEEHLLRLQLTRELQKSHLKLSGIREAMDRLSVDQMRDMVKKAVSAVKAWDRVSLERWLEGRVAGAAASPEWNTSLLDLAGGAAGPRGKLPEVPSRLQRPAPAAARGRTWERIELAHGFEVLVRTDLVHRYTALIEEMSARVQKVK